VTVIFTSALGGADLDTFSTGLADFTGCVWLAAFAGFEGTSAVLDLRSAVEMTRGGLLSACLAGADCLGTAGTGSDLGASEGLGAGFGCAGAGALAARKRTSSERASALPADRMVSISVSARWRCARVGKALAAVDHAEISESEKTGAVVEADVTVTAPKRSRRAAARAAESSEFSGCLAAFAGG
jgi:hypothetical protein